MYVHEHAATINLLEYFRVSCPNAMPFGYEELMKHHAGSFWARVKSAMGRGDKPIKELGEISILFNEETREDIAATFGKIEPVNDGLGWVVYSREVDGENLSPEDSPMNVQFFVDKQGRRFDYRNPLNFLRMLKAENVDCGPDGILFSMTWNGDEKQAFSFGKVKIERDVASKLQEAQSLAPVVGKETANRGDATPVQAQQQ